MSRYIDADLLQEDFKADHGGKRSLMIDTQPTADVVPVVHAEWIEHEMYCICNSCNALATAYFNYCPFCGAKMDEEVSG